MLAIRPATSEDTTTLCALDPLAQHDPVRASFITQAAITGHCHLILATDAPVGYGILDNTFFGQAFIALLYIHPAYRRHGAGRQLLIYFESISHTPKLFTSTNLSNLPMQSLLARQGFQLSGVIHNLDEDDPELIYVKFIQPAAAAPPTEQPSWNPTSE